MSPTTTRICSIGAARRLQALAAAGYGSGIIAHHLAAPRWRVTRWRQPYCQQIWLATHQRVDYLYQRFYHTDGPSSLARQHARLLGWQPVDAWTDTTIDDPIATPYSDPAQTSHVDWVLLDQVRTRQRPHGFLQLTNSERLVLLREHFLQHGGTLRGFKDRHRPVPVEILRVLVASDDELAACGALKEVWPVEDLRLVG